MLYLLKPAYGLLRHAITQTASLLVYHFSGPYISFFMRRGYEWCYEMIYGTPNTWTFENVFHYMPWRERWTNRGFQYGEQYGPMICATLAAWLVQGLQDLLISLLMRRRTPRARSGSERHQGAHHDVLQIALDTLMAIRDQPNNNSPLHVNNGLNESGNSEDAPAALPNEEQISALNERLEQTIQQIQQLLHASNPSLIQSSKPVLLSQVDSATSEARSSNAAGNSANDERRQEKRALY